MARRVGEAIRERVGGMKRGDPVVYSPDPWLYGEMEVWQVRKDGRLVCRVDPDRDGPAQYEVFDAEELELIGVMAA